MAESDDLHGFFIVPKKDYKLLLPGDKIKYRRNDGQMKSGGFIWYTKKGKDNRDFWMVSPSKDVDMNNRKITRYPVFWDQLDTLWQQRSTDTELMREAVDIRKRETDKLKNLIMDQQLLISEIMNFLELKHGEEFRAYRRSIKKQKALNDAQNNTSRITPTSTSRATPTTPINMASRIAPTLTSARDGNRRQSTHK